MKKSSGVALSATVLCTVLIVGACAPPPSAPGNDVHLPEVEVLEYEGEDLSPISYFRENSIMGPQYVDVGEYRLTIGGLVENDVTYRYDEVITTHPNYRKVVTLFCVEGWNVTILWEGMLLKDLLTDAGVLSDAHTVIFRAVDGYSTSLPLDHIIENDILLAHRVNEVTLPPERGFPFHLVAESKWGYKWIKWVTDIELSDDEYFLGYWEQRGFSNTADVDKSFFA